MSGGESEGESEADWERASAEQANLVLAALNTFLVLKQSLWQ